VFGKTAAIPAAVRTLYLDNDKEVNYEVKRRNQKYW